MTLSKLFEEEEIIRSHVKDIAQLILELSDFVVATRVLDLAQAEVLGKKVQNVCDKLNTHVHKARKLLGILMTKKTSVLFKGKQVLLPDIENDLSLIHGDVDSIGRIGLDFYKAENRGAAFENLERHYDDLVEHVTNLVVDDTELKDLPRNLFVKK
ncbi:hypothetical protein COV18_00620 [Candidatus Woesearchaeota archaeon CG10_big_fil_rev_8_21_14_0_10_37_12]|nr:MAG: hypothetical protein COV18_00620 [Candidatus Woesearchaeota archaeon CG10_big_fil_rev_8_21_14_0_10_37_12]